MYALYKNRRESRQAAYDAPIPGLGSPLEINVRNSGDAGRFLAAIKDEAAQKYTVTNVSFKVRAGYARFLLSPSLTLRALRSSPRLLLHLLLLVLLLLEECSLRLRRVSALTTLTGELT